MADGRLTRAGNGIQLELCDTNSEENSVHRERMKLKRETASPVGTFQAVPRLERRLTHGDAVHRLGVWGVAVPRNHILAGLGDFSPGIRSHNADVQQEDSGANGKSGHRHL